MMKIDGKEYPVSLFKGYIDDEFFKEVKYLKELYGIKTNLQVMVSIVHQHYLMVKELEAKAIEQKGLAKAITESPTQQDSSTDQTAPQ